MNLYYDSCCHVNYLTVRYLVWLFNYCLYFGVFFYIGKPENRKRIEKMESIFSQFREASRDVTRVSSYTSVDCLYKRRNFSMHFEEAVDMKKTLGRKKEEKYTFYNGSSYN